MTIAEPPPAAVPPAPVSVSGSATIAPTGVVRVLVVAATFNNAGTLAAVLHAVLATGLPVLVVNDGSTDATPAVLATFADRVDVLTHAANRGKAAALRTGFARAAAAGYTHVATIDTDAQHDPADLPALVAAAAARPAALVLGVRDVAICGYPRANRLGRWASNLLVRLEGGGRVRDSQCGLRVYPLNAVAAAGGSSGRYGFETEILTRGGWAGVPTVEVPVRCVYAVAGGRVSHYRPWRDTLRIAGLHARLLTGALARWLDPRAAWHAARRDPAEQRRLAAAVAAGVLIGNLPVYGLQTAVGIAVARKFRLQPLAVITGSHVSTPPIGPLLIAAAIGLGHWLIHGRFLTRADLNLHGVGYVTLFCRVAVDWTLGSVVLGTTLALLTYAVVRLAFHCMPKSRAGDAGVARGR